MAIQPLGSRILVKVQEAETQTASGLYIPDTAQEKTQAGSVVAVGNDQDIEVKPGQKIMYDKYAGSSVKIDGTEHLVVKNDDVIAIIDTAVRPQPLGKRVLIKVQEAETQTASGLYIPDTAQEKTQNGTVIAVGRDEEIEVKEGQKVMYDKYAGSSVKIDGVEHLVVKNDDIIAIID